MPNLVNRLFHNAATINAELSISIIRPVHTAGLVQ